MSWLYWSAYKRLEDYIKLLSLIAVMYIRLSSSFRLSGAFAQPSRLYLKPSLNKFSLRAFATVMSKYQITNHVGGALIDAVADDHQEMYTYYDQYVKSTGDVDAQERWANQFTWEVARHAVGEELVIYPLMEKHLGEKGKQLADNDRSDHQEVKNLLYQLESLKPGTSQHADLLKNIVDHLKPHNDSEEQEDLPLLQKAIGEQGSQDAAASFKRTKKFVPTRSHPSAPDQPPFETLAGLMAAPIDKLKDMFTKFPTEEQKASVKN
ncbi:putative hemerythrin-like protein [Psilocybe cubensis]|uniref:Hemerythrin-like domain-containing protein n=2 Tax=Psilocybe cubensis TaxID=181762 RepID=A0A8H8CEQ3_PSICU|nr:putative hemerythrin-like protein [Psilocybe cubensis]KAH9476295.1 putative hemerythrin-like protein [Psilocybe cubensis]